MRDIAEIKSTLAGEGILAGSLVKIGKPSREIAEEAKRLSAYAVLLLAGKGYSRAAAEIVNSSPCPVIIFSPRRIRLVDKLRGILSLNLKKASSIFSLSPEH